MQADLESIVCKFGGDPTICLREEAIGAIVYRQTDGRTDDGRRAIALAYSWNELKINDIGSALLEIFENILSVRFLRHSV